VWGWGGLITSHYTMARPAMALTTVLRCQMQRLEEEG
jgi:hypothetical protein